jgi:hypothetical protein
MSKLQIGVIDLVTNAPTRQWYARAMNANLSGIMPQVVATWCEQAGHDVSFVCYTGMEDIVSELPANVDLVFITAFTRSAQLAYALSHKLRSAGAVTVLGGPHARCYPEDAQQYFDYVLGFTDRELLGQVIEDCSPHRPIGLRLAAAKQPTGLPGVRERWKYVEANLKKAPYLKIVPMIASLGCPYTCSFCIDAEVAYEPLDLDTIREDLRFIRTKLRRPIVGWHDPNFGVRFHECMDAIEEAVPPGSIDFISETSLSLLSLSHLERLKKNGFKAVLPGIESWFDMGQKSKTGARKGLEKVQHVAEHVNQILRYVPYIQTNFVVGLDSDEGPEPFELTKRFVDLAPGAFPTYPLFSAFGQAAPLNLQCQSEGRILPFPFHLLDNNHAMNVRPLNYSWTEFYDRVVDLTTHTCSWKAIARRVRANTGGIPRLMNVLRAVSSEGFGRIRYYTEIRRRLDQDPEFRPYFEQETTKLPAFFLDRIRRELGPLWDWLPAGALDHDPNAYLKATAGAAGN